MLSSLGHGPVAVTGSGSSRRMVARGKGAAYGGRMDSARRLTGCLSRADADRQWHERVNNRDALLQPGERVARRKYGDGYALYAVPRDTDRAKPR
jgi:hypothetical protein